MRSGLLILILLATFLGAACARSGGGGGGGTASGAGAGSGSGSGGAGGTVTAAAPLRLLGFDRRALSPGAPPALWLVVERRGGAAAGAFVLEESADGAMYAPVGIAPAAVLAGAIQYELPWPAQTRYYRVSAPGASNRVRVDPSAAGAGGALTVTAPGAGATGVARTPAVAAAGGAGARTFVFAIVDEAGALAWLAESAAASAAAGAAGAIDLVAPAMLAPGALHLATAIAVDGEAFGFAAAPRVDFETRP